MDELYKRLELCKYGAQVLKDEDTELLIRELCDIIQELLEYVTAE